jgi:hypothetical protein
MKSVAFVAWVSLSLTPEDAEQLSRHARALFERYMQPRCGTEHPVIGYCAFMEQP